MHHYHQRVTLLRGMSVHCRNQLFPLHKPPYRQVEVSRVHLKLKDTESHAVNHLLVTARTHGVAPSFRYTISLQHCAGLVCGSHESHTAG